MLGHVLHLDGVSQVRLISAVLSHGLVEGDAWEDLGNRLALGELGKDALEDRLHRLEHVVLLDETHLDVELIELAGQAVGARVLVAETRRDLKIAIEARHHDELLVLLRRLGQGVEVALMNAARYQEVASTFRRRRGQDRCRELEKAGGRHFIANGTGNRDAAHDVVVQRVPAQIQEAVLQAQVFRVVRFAKDGYRQLLGGRKNFDLGREELHLTGWQLGIDGALGTLADLAVDTNDPLGT